jgi:hypothetical protein
MHMMCTIHLSIPHGQDIAARIAIIVLFYVLSYFYHALSVQQNQNTAQDEEANARFW